MGAGPGPATGAAPAPVFVLTTGRSGSTLLSRMLNEHPRLLSLSELFNRFNPEPFPGGILSGDEFASHLTRMRLFFGLICRNRLEQGGELMYPVDGGGRFDRWSVPSICMSTLPLITSDPDGLYDEVVAFARRRPAASVADHYSALFNWLRHLMDRQVVVERSGMSVMLLPQLLTAFPQARFVHLYRDGRECAISMSRHNGFRLLSALRSLERASGIDLMAADIDDLPPAPPGLPADLRDLWPDRLNAEALGRLHVPVASCAATWSKFTLAGLRLLRRVAPDRLHTMSYEDLLAEPRRTLSALARFLRVDDNGGWLDRSAALATDRPPRFPTLDAEEQSAVESACRMAMKKLRQAS
ncbi:MAG TPA: sulfotransferase [Acidimicrobiales bacterium]|nr:sulfotransferase [Acidimicrobiales bacterium]